jgi:hypothetical protein
VNAKVEGRGPPEVAKETMGSFKSFMGRLLKVTPEEVVEQQRLHDEGQSLEDTPSPKRKKRKKLSMFAKSDELLRTSTLPRR